MANHEGQRRFSPLPFFFARKVRVRSENVASQIRR
jgi:hypothetical protein